MANAEIKIGSIISSMGIAMVVTEEKKNYWLGYHEYKGKKREIVLSKSTLTNPHYCKSMTITNPK